MSTTPKLTGWLTPPLASKPEDSESNTDAQIYEIVGQGLHGETNEVKGGGFLHGWLDENWALCSHRFWSGSIGRCIAYTPTKGHRSSHSSAFLTLGTALSPSRGRILKCFAPNPSHSALRSV